MEAFTVRGFLSNFFISPSTSGVAVAVSAIIGISGNNF